MKIRKRLGKKEGEGEVSFWPSFTDIMTTICLVFFLIMIVTNILITKLNKENEDWKKKYAALEEELKDYIENIGTDRAELYEKVELTLKESGMGEDVYFNKEDGKIEIKTEALFEFGDADLKPEGVALAESVSKAFCALLDDEELRTKINYIEVVGHTDFIDTATSNRVLSSERAANFVNAMLPHGSDEEYKYGKYFKASGMSEFESKNGLLTEAQEKEARKIIEEEKNSDEILSEMGLPTEEMRALDRRIEIRINFKEDDIRQVVIESLTKNKE